MQVISYALHQCGAIEVQHEAIGGAALAAPHPLQICRRQGQLQLLIVQTNDDADLGQPVRHLQAHLITQGSLGQLCQWLPASEPLQLPLMAAEAEM